MGDLAISTGHEMTPLMPPPGQRLTPRARAYLMISAWRHMTVGAAIILFPYMFDSESFDGLRNAVPLITHDKSMLAWAVIFLLSGIVCSYAAVTAREYPARFALILSIMSSLIWAGGFAAAFYDGARLSPVGLIFALSLAGKDLTMLRDPLRNPFEPLIRNIVASENLKPSG